MKLVIPDVSVLLKWVLPSNSEPDGEAALCLRDAAVAGEVLLLVPDLWLYEVGNILTRRFPAQSLQMLEVLIDFGLPAGVMGNIWRKEAVRLVQNVWCDFL